MSTSGATSSPQPQRSFEPMNVTPQNMLKAFREHGDPDLKKQLELFKQMNAGDQRELLFLMAANTNLLFRQILNKLQPVL